MILRFRAHTGILASYFLQLTKTMTLPIIIKLERHWDEVSTEAIRRPLSSLKKLGYDHLCFESASDRDAAEEKYFLQENIAFIQENLATVQALFKKNNIHIPDLSTPHLSVLAKKLLPFTGNFSQSLAMARQFKEYPALLKKKQLFEEAMSLNMTIKGVDLPSKQFDRITESLGNIPQLTQKLKLTDDDRIQAFKHNLLKLKQEGHGLIFSVGQIHFEKLVKAFIQAGCLSDVLFIHPYSPKIMDKIMDDKALPPLNDKQAKTQLSLIEREIHNEEDMEAFCHLLRKSILTKSKPFQIKHWEASSVLTEDIASFFAQGKIATRKSSEEIIRDKNLAMSGR